MRGIDIFISTRNSSYKRKELAQNIKNTIGLNERIYNITFVENDNQYSLAYIYNKCFQQSKFNYVLFLHDDVSFLERGWGSSILSSVPITNCGIVGLAGITELNSSQEGMWWKRKDGLSGLNPLMCGNVYHVDNNGSNYLSDYSFNTPSHYLLPSVLVDGVFMLFNKTHIKDNKPFDEDYPHKFHFYDVDTCIKYHLKGVKIGVITGIKMVHYSHGNVYEQNGELKKDYKENKEHFFKKYPDTYKVPVEIITDKTVNLMFKNRVSIIIPTKSKLDLLFQCVDSFIKNTKHKYYEIIIADTGSTPEEKQKIRDKYEFKPHVKLVEYDYYNFAKINNDVVKNHATGDVILFSNNDIKIVTDVVTFMLEKTINKKTGTVGARLHYADGTIQHSGIITNGKSVTHYGLNSSYKYINTNGKLNYPFIGSTGALLMIRKSVFEKAGMFNEAYEKCFEDVELNIKCLELGYQNVFVSSAVAYHYESQTRKEEDNYITENDVKRIEKLLEEKIK